MANLEAQRARLAQETVQYTQKAAKVFDTIRSFPQDLLDTYQQRTYRGNKQTAILHTFVSPHIVLPAQKVVPSVGNGATRRVAVQMYLTYDNETFRSTKLPSKTPLPLEVGFNGRPIALPIEAATPQMIYQHDSRALNGKPLTLLKWFAANLCPCAPTIKLQPNDPEWWDWYVFREYPREALKPDMLKFHQERLVGGQALLSQVEKALGNRELNSRR